MKGPELEPHQVDAMQRLRNGSVLKGGVGSGKTHAALGYFYSEVCGGGWSDGGELVRPETPKDLYVLTTAKKRDSFDWQDTAFSFGLSSDRSLGQSGIQVTVDSWQNVAKYVDVKGAFFIFDEQRLIGSGAWVKAFYKIAKANEWILLTATPGDHWMDYCPIFVAHGFYKNRTEFKWEHVVYKTHSKHPQIDHFINQERLRYLRDRIVVEMPFSRRTTRHVRDVEPSYDEGLLRQVKTRWNPFTNEPIKDASEYFAAARRVVNSDPSRLAGLAHILGNHRRVILFYNFNYERDAILAWAATATVRLDGADHALTTREWSGHAHQSVPEGSGPWLYLVQYTAGAEGWNCVTTDTVAFWSLNYSYKVFEQCQGRIDRLNTPYEDLYYYVFKSDSWIDERIWDAIERKEVFSETANWTKRT